jgi:hypothetical protein
MNWATYRFRKGSSWYERYSAEREACRRQPVSSNDRNGVFPRVVIAFNE